MERERRDENHVNARASHSATAWPSLPSLFIVSQSEQHVSASPVYYCLLRWLVKSVKLLDTQSQFHLSHTPLYKGTKEVGNIKSVEIKENWNIL
jgi:hypothetical protein